MTKNNRTRTLTLFFHSRVNGSCLRENVIQQSIIHWHWWYLIQEMLPFSLKNTTIILGGLTIHFWKKRINLYLQTFTIASYTNQCLCILSATLWYIILYISMTISSPTFAAFVIHTSSFLSLPSIDGRDKFVSIGQLDYKKKWLHCM